MKSKKSQIIGQVFIYMMAVVVIGGIVLIGYGAVKKIVVKGCDAEKASFKSNLESMIEKYNSYGSINAKTLKAPCDYDTICFVSAADIGATSLNFRCNDNPIIRDSVTNNIKQNIFAISKERTIPIGYSDLISLNSTDTGKCLCVEDRGRSFYITFNGKGSSTEIVSG